MTKPATSPQAELGGFPSHCTLDERKPTKWARMTPPPLKVVVSVNTTVNQLLPPLPAIATLPNQTRQTPKMHHPDGCQALTRPSAHSRARAPFTPASHITCEFRCEDETLSAFSPYTTSLNHPPLWIYKVHLVIHPQTSLPKYH